MNSLADAAASGRPNTGDELLTLFSMGSRKLLRMRHADFAHGDVDSVGKESDKNSIIAKHRLINGVVVGEHGDDHFTSRGGARRIGEMCAALNQRRGLRFCAVIDGEVMSNRQQIGGHGTAHVPEPEKPSFML